MGGRERVERGVRIVCGGPESSEQGGGDSETVDLADGEKDRVDGDSQRTVNQADGDSQQAMNRRQQDDDCDGTSTRLARHSAAKAPERFIQAKLERAQRPAQRLTRKITNMVNIRKEKSVKARRQAIVFDGFCASLQQKPFMNISTCATVDGV